MVRNVRDTVVGPFLVRDINWDYIDDALPAFLTIYDIPLPGALITNSILQSITDYHGEQGNLLPRLLALS